MHIGVDDPRQHEQPAQDQQHRVQRLGDEGEQHHDIEQHRQFELIVKGVGDLGHPRWPVRLAQPNLLWIDLTAADGADAEPCHPEQKHEGESHLHEHRQQNCLDRHDTPPLAPSPARRIGRALIPDYRRSPPLNMDGSSIDGRPSPPLNLGPKDR